MKNQLFIIVALFLFSIFLFGVNHFNNKVFAENKVEESVETQDKQSNKYNIEHIVLITLESVRWDNLSYMGYIRETTPFLKNLANRSYVFENMITPIPMTAPSHASILTSLYPNKTKFYINDSYLESNYKTLAEYLDENNFQTLAFWGTRAMSESNFEQGFNVFGEVGKSLTVDELMNRENRRRMDTETMELVFNELDKSSEENIFLMLHLDNPHRTKLEKVDDYIPTDDDPSDDLLLEHWKEKQHLSIGLTPRIDCFTEECFPMTESEKALAGMNRYDGAIQEADSHIRDLYEYFEKNDLNKNTLWLIIPDHGEGLGSHDFSGHSHYIYQEQIKTPLIMHMPGQTEGQRIPYLSENVDIFPTIIDILGIKPEIDYSLEGVSLLRVLDEGPQKDYYFSMTSTFKQFSLLNENFKYIYIEEKIADGEKIIDTDMFFNIKQDPFELNNIINTAPEIENEFKNIILNKTINSFY